MGNKWLAALIEAEEKHNTSAALREAPPVCDENPDTPQSPPSKTSKTPLGFQDRLERLREKLRTRQNPPSKTSDTPTGLSRFAQQKLEKASKMGLLASWSQHYGYVGVHDPTTGEWHDLHTKDAPGWAVREARRRKGGKVYPPTARQVEERREDEREHAPHPAVTDKGIVFEDYIKET